MITSNVIHRVFQLRHGGNLGTCFTVDVNGRQYLITARHCVESLGDGDAIELYHEGVWKTLDVRLVGHSSGDIDISVLAPPKQLSPAHPLPASSEGLALGQDAYFLGFPFGLSSDSMDLNGGFPIALVKKAIVSSLEHGTNGVTLLDGLNNPGFSGGPVVFSKPGPPKYSVASVISAYRFNALPVNHAGAPTSLTVNENTGIIISYPIRHAVALVESNPIGPVLGEPNAT